MPLQNDYRPSCLEEIYGNDHIKSSLESIFAREKDFPHAYLFHGVSGTGKTTLGRIIANLLKCSSSDLYEYNTANMRGIDTVREIDQNCRYAPMNGKTKVYILDEVHRTTVDFQNALLKLLEDTPSHVYFILCTTEPNKLLKTIHTRCSTYQTKLLLNAQMKQLLNDVLVSESIDDFSEAITKKIIEKAEGCPRQALVLLDQVIDITNEETALSAIDSFTGENAEFIEICRLLVDRTDKDKWDKIRKMITNVDEEPETIRRITLGYLSKVLLSSKSNDRIADMISCFVESWYYSGKGGMIQSFYFASKL